MKNFKLTIEYDGTNYHGWQIQKIEPTIQQEIEKALEKMTRTKTKVIGAGRTDAGVHALGQAASFKCKTSISPDAFKKGLNSILPKDIVISQCIYVQEQFHARYDAENKIYLYKILNTDTPSPILRNYVWHIKKKLDIDSMQKAAMHLCGTHDFKAFEGAGSPKKDTFRYIEYAQFTKENSEIILFEIKGNGFLKFMVRNIVGTLAEAGIGKITADDFKDILFSKDRTNAGPTAPAQGLFLVDVNYPVI